MNKLLLFGVLFVLCLSLVSAQSFVFHNVDKQPFSMVEIVSNVLSYKDDLLRNSCIDDNFLLLKFDGVCGEGKYLSSNSYIIMKAIEYEILKGVKN